MMSIIWEYPIIARVAKQSDKILAIWSYMTLAANRGCSSESSYL